MIAWRDDTMRSAGAGADGLGFGSGLRLRRLRRFTAFGLGYPQLLGLRH